MDLKVIWTVFWVIKRKLNGDLPPTSLFYFIFISKQFSIPGEMT